MARPAPPVRLPLPVAIAAGLGAAGLFASVLWHHLPYEALERTTAAERFWAWEAVVWMIGLALGLLSVAVLVEVRRSIRTERGGGIPAAQWALMSCGGGLIAVGAIARVLFGG